MTRLRLLLVEGSQEDALLLLRELERGGYDPDCERVVSLPTLVEALGRQEWDLIISDYRMPGYSAPEALESLKGSGLDLPFIIVSGKIGEENLVDAMRSGAHDYLMKGHLSRLIPAVQRELREAKERRTRRRAELSIRQGKMEWEAAFDAVSDIVVLTDPAWKIIRCNSKLTEYLGAGYSGVIGRDITELFYGEMGAKESIFSRCSALKPDQEDVLFPSLPGWYTVSCYPMHPTESTHGYVYIIKDVTGRRLMEEEKRVTDRELLTLYAVASRLNSRRGFRRIMVDLLSQLHQLLQIDVSCIYLLEGGALTLTAELGLARRFVPAFQELPQDAEWVHGVLEGEHYRCGEFSGQFSGEAAKGALVMGLNAWCALPLTVGSGVIGLLFVSHRAVRPYTDREVYLLTSVANQMAILMENHTLYDRMKMKNEELERNKRALKEHLEVVKRANSELGRLNDAKNSFIGMASHELKTPLTSIKGGLQFLLEYSDLNVTPEQRKLLEGVYEGVTQLKGIIDDLLNISRMEAEGFVLQRRSVTLSLLCGEVLRSLALPLSERDIRVSVVPDGVAVMADEGLCRLVVRNLLENAIKFTPDGGGIIAAGALVAREELLAQGDELRRFYRTFPANLEGAELFYRFTISDTGVGIDEEEQVRIFDKFYGIGEIDYHSSGKSGYMSKGTGLGLAIVKGIMDAHAGMVWVSPGDEGRGSIFSILLPVAGSSPA